ncbi:MAG: helix-turn-helix transcriptional regulator [Solirubrobacteraceae bacterium]
MLDPPATVGGEDALAQPTRARLFALLVELKRAAGTPELAARLGLHPNGVRLHLERLQRAGLVARAQVRAGRGRPADVWMVAPGARPGGRAPRAYRDLGRWLARAMTGRGTGPAALERSGRAIGRELAPADAAPGTDAVEEALAALGFAPTLRERSGDRLTVCLGNCPYRDVVRENPPAICALHKGITRGLIDVLAPGVTLSAFVPHDPEVAGCEVELIVLHSQTV